MMLQSVTGLANAGHCIPNADGTLEQVVKQIIGDLKAFSKAL
jgi:hypothetical protein